jgi:DNA-binding MarR family transcriptional regulator
MSPTLPKARHAAPTTPAIVTEPAHAAPVREGPGTLSLGVLTDVLGYHLAQATVTTMDTFERHIAKPFGLRKVEYSLLLLLLANGPLSPKRLGRALALSAPNLTMLLDRLQQRSLVHRERSATDGRSQNIVLTDDGRRVAEQSGAAAVAMEKELDDRLSRAERMMLIELLRKVAGR